jgi:2-polyprenyl-3-methyl-5-hydroxy-6-metoxy-1,4-benzoquinol methylase
MIEYEARWREALAPESGDIRGTLVREAAEYLGLTEQEAERSIDESAGELNAEWDRIVADSSDPGRIVRFYNESRAELFEQIAWHSTEPIHHRSLVCADMAAKLPGRDFLDFGSGIGSNAMVFALHGFRVTLADVADPLRNFAKWRCERRGISAAAVDLKSETLPRQRYDVITCFDVLEHVPDPLQAVKTMRDALRPGGVLFLYAPFGFDPDRPMHIVHADPVSAKIRSLGFSIKHDWERQFPDYLQKPFPPRPYQHVRRSTLVNAAYYVRDVWLNGPITDAAVIALRRFVGGKRNPPPQSMRENVSGA